MNKWIKIVPVIIFIAAVAGAAWYLQKPKQAAAPASSQTKTEPPASLYSINGTVKSRLGDSMVLTLADGSTRNFNAPFGTPVVKRIANKTSYTLQTASLSLIKTGSEVVVYFINDRDAAKIEIIK